VWRCCGRNKGTDRHVIFEPDLGLAIESLPPGATLDALWRVV
jgi:hypothetical protein